MSRFRRFACFFVLIEIIIFAIIIIYKNVEKKDVHTKQYNVEISRIAGRMESGESISDINLAEYEHILSVDLFDMNEIYDHEYAVRRVKGELYCFQYYVEAANNKDNILIVFAAFVILSNILLLIYIDKKVLSPFDDMNRLTTELAKGNLATPVKQEKSRYFARFLWGMDMLRETLEENKKRELELLKEKKTLVLSLSHDIKTPLAAIDLYSKALQRNLYESDEERKAAYDGITNGVSEIKRYVDEISKASREGFLKLETSDSEIYISECINKVSTYYAEKMKHLHIDFVIDTLEDCLVSGDEDRLIEVMQNCIENAIKYGDGSRICISFDEEENCRLITVSNTGCELREEELTHIFDSFYRGSNSSSEEGSGLGLFICKELMKKMDGDIFAKIIDDEYRITIVVKKVM